MVAAATLSLASGPVAADDLLERGDYLVNTILACGNCHTASGEEGPEAEMAGGQPIVTPQFTAFAANITPDAETGIGAWSDAEIGRAIREGLDPDGKLLAPVMPAEFYQHISDRDLAAIIAYLRQVDPVENEVPPTKLDLELPPAWVAPVDSVPEPDRGDVIAYGKYLATIGHCMECHTPRTREGHLDFERMGAGGTAFPGPWGTSVSANITPHPQAGIGRWSDEEIRRAITEGVDASGRTLKPPMAFAYYADMTEEDLDALVAWLRTVPPQE